LKLLGIVSDGSGVYNEDAAGFAGHEDDVVAAWVFDGVTGINDRSYIGASSDAVWIVARAEHHLRQLAVADISLPQILGRLVESLIADWSTATTDILLPEGYDHPACCLLLVKRYADGWRALRLGDSFLLTANRDVKRWDGPPTDLGALEVSLRHRAKQQRAEGVADFNVLLQQFHPQLMASRRARNTEGNHSILLPDRSALVQPEIIELGWPQDILLCSDGFYRAVDTYQLLGDADLVATCGGPNGVQKVLRDIRKTEAEDIHCDRHVRFKPADDASAVMIGTSSRPLPSQGISVVNEHASDS
jgi:Protein phosphatase 2C